MTNKIIALLSLICFVMMAGLVSFTSEIIPNYMTLGKFISTTFFFAYEIMCLVSFLYFWLKR